RVLPQRSCMLFRRPVVRIALSGDLSVFFPFRIGGAEGGLRPSVAIRFRMNSRCPCPEVELAAPRPRRRRAVSGHADAGHCQAFGDLDVADGAAVDAENTATAAVVAGIGPFGA